MTMPLAIRRYGRWISLLSLSPSFDPSFSLTTVNVPSKSFPGKRSFSDTQRFKRSTVARPLTVSLSASSNAAQQVIMSQKDQKEEDPDPYLWLEEVESEASLDFAKASNAQTLDKLGDPHASPSYERILAALESDDRIPHVTQYGHDEVTGDGILFNFWRDANHRRGLWRKTTMSSYTSGDEIAWTNILDLDALGEKDGIEGGWVWKGSRPLPRSLDPDNGKVVTRTLLSLSRGGSDAVHVREFDLIKNEFVSEAEQGFILPEAKSRASYKSRDVVLVGTDFGPDSLTKSGYPRMVKEWVRGTPLEEAPVIFEGEASDVSVSVYISDERTWGGGIYEFRHRSLTFYTSKMWARKLLPEHLLAPNDPARTGIDQPVDFVEVDVQDDADVSLMGNMMMISLRSDWQPVPEGLVYIKGSLIYTPTDEFLANGAASATYKVLFEPTERTAYEYYSATKNYLLLFTMDNVQSKLEFFKIGDGGCTLTPVGEKATPRIRDCSARPLDSYSGSDLFWFTTSDFVTPSTLFMANASLVETSSTGHDKADVFVTQKLKSLPDMYNATGVIVEQKMAPSKDGTLIPYFLVMNKDTVLNGSNPTLLYGYGGFEVSLGPHYVATAGLAWLERGGVYVEANIRGGGEFGPSWHQAALKANRNKAYEDFAAVAEHLIETKVASPKTLAARGGSNGGLLVGNIYTTYPHLFGAIHCSVPLLDMKRYHKLLAGASWMAEYGDPETDDWDYLQKYSPYHNIDAAAAANGAKYPPILVTTSTRDDRVHPAHARKFVKKLMDLSQEKLPVFYYENIEGGHGGAADAKQSAFMTSLAYDFMFDTLSKNAAAL